MSGVAWGIVSTAHINRLVIPPAQESDRVDLIAVASRDDARAEEYARTWGIERAYGSYEALLEDPDVEAVYISLPNSLHCEWSIRALEAGKHVLCEKPLSRRVAEVEQMIAACADAGVVLMEAFMYRHHPQHTRVRQLLADGAIGEPAVMRASFHFAMDDERRGRPDVRVQKSLDGGAFMDVGCYALNAVRYLLDAEPVEVTALQRLDPALGVDTTFAAVLRFPGDRIALIDGGFDANGPSRYEISGFGGAITAEQAFQPDPARAILTLVRRGERTVEEIPGVDQYGLEADHFAQSVRAGRLLPPAENGLAQARALEALYQSAETGQSVRLP